MGIIGYIVMSIIVTVLLVGMREQLLDSTLTTNNEEKDYTRWSPTDIAIAGYVALYVEDNVRLNIHFKSLIYAVLQRSDRAVDEKIRRISTSGSSKSDASASDVEVAIALASCTKQEAMQNFYNNLYIAGASRRQVIAIQSYL